MVDTATLQKQLEEAEAAKHQLITGTKTVSLSYSQGGGSRAATFTQANLGVLNAHIIELKAKLGLGSPRRPFRFR